MKRILLMASILAAGSTSVYAQYYGEWRRDRHPYAARRHDACQNYARKLHDYEYRARADGYITKDERADMRTLRADLDRNCGRYRHRDY